MVLGHFGQTIQVVAALSIGHLLKYAKRKLSKDFAEQ